MTLSTKWMEAHGFPCKIVNGYIYWQTNYQTGETWEDEDREIHLEWHDRDYFESV